jgi:hypothetical protein
MRSWPVIGFLFISLHWLKMTNFRLKCTNSVWQRAIATEEAKKLKTFFRRKVRRRQGDQIGRIFAYVLGEFSPTFWANFRLYIGQLFSSVAFSKTAEVAQILRLQFSAVNFNTKLGWASFWAILSKTHLVTLGGGAKVATTHCCQKIGLRLGRKISFPPLSVYEDRGNRTILNSVENFKKIISYTNIGTHVLLSTRFFCLSSLALHLFKYYFLVHHPVNQMTGISLHMYRPLTSQSHAFDKVSTLVITHRSRLLLACLFKKELVKCLYSWTFDTNCEYKNSYIDI